MRYIYMTSTSQMGRIRPPILWEDLYILVEVAKYRFLNYKRLSMCITMSPSSIKKVNLNKDIWKNIEKLKWYTKTMFK